MVKIRKQRKRKTYKYAVNRKKMKNRAKRIPSIRCGILRPEWDKRKTPKTNLKEMGLVHNVNDAVKIPGEKMEVDRAEAPPPVKGHVAKELEADSKLPRVKKFRLPKNQVNWLCKLLDTHGEDYKAMENDRKLNCFQDTWRAIRRKINLFKKIPEQYNEYLKTKNIQQEIQNS